MVDMDALERQVADVARRVVGPPRPLDALAIARGSATNRVVTRPRSLSGGALRFLAASAVLALFGGLLVIGFSIGPSDERSLPGAAVSAEPTGSPVADPTTSASASPERVTRTDVLAGVSLVTEEVEPGVLRVLSDGVRELSRPTPEMYDVWESTISAGRDGSVWVFSSQRFFRLGDEAEHAWDGAAFIQSVAPSVAPDGTVWLPDGDVLRVFDGRRWQVALQGANGFHMWPDGTMWTRDQRGHLLRGDGSSWTDVHAELEIPGPTFPDQLDQLWVSPRIDRGFAADVEVSAGNVAFQVLTRHGEDGDPDEVSVAFIGADTGTVAGAVEAPVHHVDMADAGDWWIYQGLDVPLAGSGNSHQTHRYLVHVDDIPRRVYGDAEGVPEIAHSHGGGLLEAGGDGSCLDVRRRGVRQRGRVRWGGVLRWRDVAPCAAWRLCLRPGRGAGRERLAAGGQRRLASRRCRDVRDPAGGGHGRVM